MTTTGPSLSQVIVRIPTPLRSFTEGADEVALAAGTAGAALKALGQRHEGLLARVLDAADQVRPFVNIYVGQQDIRTLQGLETPLRNGDILSIIPAVAGGAATAAASEVAP